MYINECVIRLYKLTAGNWARGSVLIFSPGCAVASYCGFGLSGRLTLTLHKSLVQKRYACSISGHQETLVHFQDLTVC